MKNFTRILAGVLAAALVFTGLPALQGTDRADAAYTLSEDVSYLSDMSYVRATAKDNKLRMDRNASNQTIRLVMDIREDEDGKTIKDIRSFIKGIGAWASSELVYEIPTDFEFFEAYIGVDAARTETYYNGGVSFRIYLSNDLTNWQEKKSIATLKGWDKAEQVKLPLESYKYIKLVADENGDSFYSSWYDDAVYADAKFTRKNYTGENITPSEDIKTLEAYNSEISGFISAESLTEEQKFTVLKREYISRIGYDILKSYYTLSSTYQDAVDWLFNDKENLQYYLDVNLGSSENYANSLKILAELYSKHGSDFSNDLYKRMAIALACSHVNGVSYWASGGASNGSDAVTRYEIFKDLHAQGRLNSAFFDSASIPEMRIIMGNQISDDQIKWLNWYAASDKGRSSSPNYSSPDLSHGSYIIYNSKLDWNYNDPKYFSGGSVTSEIDNKYSLSSNNVNTSDSKLWAVMEEGAVCGGQSKTGANLRGVYGIPSFVIGQPGHAAYFYQSENTGSGKKWTIGNNIYGWWKSEYGGNMLGWTGNFGNIRWAGKTGPDNRYYTGSYLVLEQEAVNDIEALRNSRHFVYMAKATDDVSIKESLYENALKDLSINVEAWLGLLDIYESKDDKDSEYVALAERMAEAFKYHPLPMSDLLTLVKDLISDGTKKATVESLRVNTLKSAKEIDDAETLQPDVTKTIATNLLSTSQVEMATFSLDGPDAGKIIFDASYRTDSKETGFLYSLTGAHTGKTGEVEVDWIRRSEGIIELTPEEIESLSEENGIFVKLEGQHNRDMFSITLTRAEKPEGLGANDDDDVVLEAKDTMEWSMNNGTTWTRFDKETPDLSGNKTVWVRNGSTGHILFSKEHVELTFTESADPITRKYISALNVEVTGSSNHNQSTLAENVLDGNVSTYWSSTQRFTDPYKRILFTFDKQRFITSLDIYPRQNSDYGRIRTLEIGVSQDKDYNVVSTLKTIDMKGITGNDPYTVTFDRPVYTKYLYVRETDENNNFICISLIKIYEDRTKDADDDEDTDIDWEIDEEIGLPESRLFAPGIEIKTKDGQKYLTSKSFTGKTIWDIVYGTSGGYNEDGVDVISEEYRGYASIQIKDASGNILDVNEKADTPISTGMILEILNMTKNTSDPDYSYILAVPSGEEEDLDMPEFDAHDTHLFDAVWSISDTHHWKNCIGCDETDGYGEHIGELVNQRDATTTKKGYTGDSYCRVCKKFLEKGHYTPKLVEDDDGPGGDGGSGSEDPGGDSGNQGEPGGDGSQGGGGNQGGSGGSQGGGGNQGGSGGIQGGSGNQGGSGGSQGGNSNQGGNGGSQGGSGNQSGSGDSGSSTGGTSQSGGSSFTTTSSSVSAPSIPSNVQISGNSAGAVGVSVSNGNAFIAGISENALNAVVNTSETDLVIDLSKINTNVNKVTLTTESVSNIASVLMDTSNNTSNLEITLAKDTINLDAKALEAIADQAEGRNVVINISVNSTQGILNDAQKKTANDMDSDIYRSVERAVNLTITSGDSIISDFRGGIVRIGLSSFKPGVGKYTSNYHVYYMSESGEAERMPTWFSDNKMLFRVGHFSEYIVVYDTTIRNGEAIPVYRLYNPGNGDHLYTTKEKEKELCKKMGWKAEGIEFYVIPDSESKVYRLYNKDIGSHVFTSSTKEKDAYVKNNWKFETVAFSGEGSINIYCLRSPEGKRIYLASQKEMTYLINHGWINEGVAFKGYI